MRRRGFSLLEIVVTSALVVAVSGLFLMATRNAGSKANSRSLAMLVAEQFRLARMEALSRRLPVALVFPTQGGTRGSCSSISWLEGEIAPKLVRHHDYSQEFPGARIFVGTWPLRPGLAWARNPAYTGQKQTMLNLDAWLPTARKKDYCFVFGPDGSVRTNDLPAFDGAYRVAVTATLAQPGPPETIGGAPTVTGGPAVFGLTGIGQTFTLSLTPTGSVTMESGLAGQDGSLKEIDSGRTTVAAAAPVPPPSSLLNTDPDVIGSITKPDPDETLPPDVTNYMTVDEHLTLETYATDPDGDQLWAFWEVTAPPGKGDGAFSYPPVDGQASKTQMSWDPTYVIPNTTRVGAWRSVVQWRPPPEAAPGDRFDLGCKVTDMPAPPVVAQIKKTVEMIPAGKILFQSDREGTRHLYRMHTNGFFQQRMFPTLGDSKDPSANIDGSRVVFVSGDDIWLYQPLAKPALVRLTNTPGVDERLPAINPVGTKVAFRRGGAIFCMNCTEGSAIIAVPGTGSLADDDRMSWSPQGDTLAYSDGASIHGWGPRTVSLSGGVYLAPYWGADDVIYFTNKVDGDPYVWAAGPGTHTGSGSNAFPSPGYDEIQPAVSPDGAQKLIVRRQHGSGAPFNIFLAVAGMRTQLTFLGENTDPVWVR